ncbi:MAG: formate dehydrogenase accessory sulfurtransferase FdhD [Pseudomonadota bacterium]
MTLPLPRLTSAQAPLTCQIDAVNEFGEHQPVFIPAERALTVYVDKRELVTLMTLGAHPEWLVLGYLRNQRLVNSVHDIESVTVDWDVGAVAVKTRHGIDDIEEKTARRVVTTGCGQGSVFGGLMEAVDQIRLPADVTISQSQLYSLVNTIRIKETTYKSAGSVHACALFDATSLEPEMLLFVEDVGRHNAIDTIAGWMWLHPEIVAPTLPVADGSLPSEPAVPPEGDLSSGLAAAPLAPPSAPQALVFYTTGRLTSEMVMKAAQMDIAVVISRSGITQMGHALAQDLGLCAIGRALNRRFLCFSTPRRLRLDIAAATGMAEAGV